ncbi:MAG: protein kinase domain-containing protein, partial [Thermoanaerobaculia bacterium]
MSFPEIGSTVAHFQILERLGRGGMGVVYKARDLRLGRLAALKFMTSDDETTEAARRRFLREARATAALNHPHVVAIHHVGEERGAPFLVMPLLHGESLAQRLGREG